MGVCGLQLPNYIPHKINTHVNELYINIIVVLGSILVYLGSYVYSYGISMFNCNNKVNINYNSFSL